MSARPRRATQRDAVAQIAMATGTVFTVDELARRVRDAGMTIGLATVYRAVTSMLESGELNSVGERDGKRVYAACAIESHHHHAVCLSCGSVSHADCPLPEGPVAAMPGFQVTRHELTLYGLCRECAGKGRDA